MDRLTIAPVGVFRRHMTQELAALISSGRRLFLQTKRCYMAKVLEERGVAYETFDGLYQSARDFTALSGEIAQALSQGGVFLVPGGEPGGETLERILALAGQSGLEVELTCSPGYGDAACAAAGVTGAVKVFASGMDPALQPDRPLAIEEVDSPYLAAQVKLALGEYYPDEWTVAFMSVQGEGYCRVDLPLYELDRQKSYDQRTVVIVPPLPFEERERMGIYDLELVVERLRQPGGCPWDREQTHASIRKDLLEEAYEVAEAIDQEDPALLCEELGDLLMQVVFHSVMSRETGDFNFRDVTTGIAKKLIYRHPHVFGQASVKDSAEVLKNWDALKAEEKNRKTTSDAMNAVPLPLPQLIRAHKLQKAAAKAGFDWPDYRGALAKIREETKELEDELETGGEEAELELGDLLFSVVNTARLAGLDAERALERANKKFQQRYENMERLMEQGGAAMKGMTLKEMDAWWEKAKKNR